MNEPLNINALRSGDQKEFEKLVIQFENQVFNLCAYLLHNKTEAEDATQEVFILTYQSLSKFKGDSKISTWIYRITLNKCKEIIRYKSRKKRFGILIDLFEQSNSSLKSKELTPEEILFEDERTNKLLSAIESLQDTQRIAYTLHNMDDYSYKEISELMQVSVSSVESLIFRAKKNLKSKLQTFYKNQ
ncbi:MAG: RNA polymerase sigma factor [Bacteroidota bacterium]